jgi:glycosyltransferase involved in cell wall biosynthesis
LEQQVRHSGLTEHVTFTGFVANPLAYVRQCNLFCLPSLYEGMPVALLEAMACGVPVVATDCPSGPREVLAGGEFGRLVPVGDPAALAAAIEQVLRDPTGSRVMTSAARRRVEEEYSAPIGIRRLERLLEAAAPPA